MKRLLFLVILLAPALSVTAQSLAPYPPMRIYPRASQGLRGILQADSIDVENATADTMAVATILKIPSVTTLVSTQCDHASEAGRAVVKTDATSGQQWYVCEGVAGWVAQGGGNLSQTDIDTFAEIDAIVADETLVNTNDAQTLTNKTISGALNTLSAIPVASMAVDIATQAELDAVNAADDDLSDDLASALSDVAYPNVLADGQIFVRDQTTGVAWENVAVSGDATLSATGVLSVVESGVDHDALANFVANEHVDHSTVTLTAGTGLTGGGDITASRSFSVTGVLEDLNTLGAPTLDGQVPVATGAGAFAYESGATLRTSIGVAIGTDVQAFDADLTDLADGSLTGTKVGFADTNGDFAATEIQSAVEEFVSVNGSGINSATAKVDWTQLGNVPAGFADGTDDGSGSSVVLDLADDGTNESTGITEIATSGDTNSIFSEPTADKLLITLSNNWPTADAATALSANGTNCSAGQYPLGVDASGNSESCTVDDDVPDAGDFGAATDLDANGAINADAVGLAEIDDAAGVPTDGDLLSVTGTGTQVAYVTPNVGTDVTADLEEETHASEHESGGADAVNHDNLTGFVANEHLDWTSDQGATNILQANVPVSDAADALSANGTNCSAGNFPLGVDASGNAETCTDAATQAELNTHAALTATHGVSGAIVGTTDTQTLTNKTVTQPTLTLKQSAGAAPTASGDLQYDTTDDCVVVGDGTNTTAFCADVGVNTQTGTTYTLVLADKNKLVRTTSASAVTVTVPPNSSVAFGVGAIIWLRMSGTGAVTASPGSGVTLNGTTALTEQYSSMTLTKIATDTWEIEAYQPLDADLTDLADGSLTGSKVGTGISATNVTTGTLPDGVIAAAITRDAEWDTVGEIETATSSDIIEAAETVTLTNKTMAAGSNTFSGFPYDICVAASDETTDLTTGTAKITFRVPRAFTLTGARASVNTAPVGSTLNVDVNEAGTSVFSTVITIDASEKTSTTAATPPSISDSAIADDAEITVDIDQIGSSTAGKGLKVCLIGTIDI